MRYKPTSDFHRHARQLLNPLAAIFLLITAFSPLLVLAREPSDTQSEAVTPAVPVAASSSLRDVSAALTKIINANKVPGLAAILIEGDTILIQGAAGVRTRGSDAAITINDQFHIGSCTKAMTATLCAVLVQEGVLRWDMTLAEAFPEVMKAQGVNADRAAAWGPITLTQLLVHHSGAPANPSIDGLWERLVNFKGTPTQARATLLEGVLRGPLDAAPGTKFIYSNTGYAIAGHMAEIKTGFAWEELMQTRIFAPLGITSAGFGAPGSADVVDQPRGHTAAGIAIVPGPRADNPAAIGPAGTAHMSLPDWARFAALHLRGACESTCGTDILTGDAFAVLHEPYVATSTRGSVDGGADQDAGDGAGATADSKDKNTYACGWAVAQRPWANGRVLTHSGSNTMWYSAIWIAPKKNIAILAVCNQGGNKGAKAADQAIASLIGEFTKLEAERAKGTPASQVDAMNAPK